MSTRHRDKSNPAGAVKNMINAELRSLYRSSDGVRGRGAIVEYLSHSPSPECGIRLTDSPTLRDYTPSTVLKTIGRAQ